MNKNIALDALRVTLSLLRKYARLDQNILNNNTDSIYRLSDMVDNLDAFTCTEEFQTFLALNNIDHFFNSKLGKLKKTRSRIFNASKTTAKREIELQALLQARRARPQQGLQQGLQQGPQQRPQQGPQQWPQQGPQQRPQQWLQQGPQQGLQQRPQQWLQQAKQRKHAIEEIEQSLIDFGPKPEDPEILEIYEDLTAQQKNLIGPVLRLEQLFEEVRRPSKLTSKRLETIIEILIENQLLAAGLQAKAEHTVQVISKMLARRNNIVGTQAGGSTEIDELEKLKGIAEAISNSSQFADNAMDIIQLAARKLTDRDINIPDLRKEILTLTNQLDKDSKIIAKNNGNLKSDLTKENQDITTRNALAMNDILNDASQMFVDGSHFAIATQASPLNQQIKTAAAGLGLADATVASNKRIIDATHNDITIIKNILIEAGNKEVGSEKLDKIAPNADRLYAYANANPNANAGLYAQQIYNTVGGPIADQVSVIVAARMSGAMYAINKKVGNEQCGNVAAKAIVKCLETVAQMHLTTAGLGLTGAGHVNFPKMGVPQYPIDTANVDAYGPLPAGAPAQVEFPDYAPPLPPPIAENIAHSIADSIANGNDIATVVGEAIDDVDQVYHSRIDYVVRELMDNSQYLAMLMVPVPAVANAMINGYIYQEGATALAAPTRVVDDDLYYTIINIASSVYVSTGDEDKAIDVGAAVGVLISMFKYGHDRMKRVELPVAAYIGIYITVSLAMLGKDIIVAAKVGFIFGQGYEHHENVRASIVAAMNVNDRLRRYNHVSAAGPYRVVNGNGQGLVGAHSIGRFVQHVWIARLVGNGGIAAVANMDPIDTAILNGFLPTANVDAYNAALEHLDEMAITGIGPIPATPVDTGGLMNGGVTGAIAALDPVEENTYMITIKVTTGNIVPHLVNAMYIAVPLLRQKIMVAYQQIVINKNRTNNPPNPPNPDRLLNKNQFKNMVLKCRDAYEVAKSATETPDISNIRMAFKLFWNIVTNTVPAASPEAVAKVATAKQNVEQATAAHAAAVAAGAAAPVVAAAQAILDAANATAAATEATAATAPAPAIIQAIIDANNMSPYHINTNLQKAGSKIVIQNSTNDNAITPIDIVSDTLFKAPEFNNSSYYQIRSKGIIPEFANLRLTASQVDIIQYFMAYIFEKKVGQPPVAGRFPNINNNDFQADINQINAMFLARQNIIGGGQNQTDACHIAQSSTNNYKILHTNYRPESIPTELVPITAINMDKAITSFDKYLQHTKKTVDAIEPQANTPDEKIAANVSNALYSSANAIYLVLQQNTGTAIAEIYSALNEILTAYSNVSPSATINKIKKIIMGIMNAPNISDKLQHSYDLLAAAQFATDFSNTYDNNKCKMMTDDEILSALPNGIGAAYSAGVAAEEDNIANLVRNNPLPLAGYANPVAAAQSRQIALTAARNQAKNVAVAATPPLVPSADYHKLNMITSAVMAVTTAIKTIYNSTDLSTTIIQPDINIEQVNANQAIRNITTALGSNNTKTVETNIQILMKELVSQYHKQQQYRYKVIDIKNSQDAYISKEMFSSLTAMKSNIDTMQSSIDTLKKIIVLTTLASIKILAK